jgi:hypothetical protein
MQFLGLRKLPVIEDHAILKAKTCQEVAPVKPHSLRQWLNAFGTGFGLWMAMSPALRQVSAELIHIQPEIRVSIQTDCLPLDLKPPLAQDFVEDGEIPAKGSACSSLVIFRPEEASQPVAATSFARNGQVSYEGEGLSTVNFNRHAVLFDQRRAQKIKAQTGHLNPPPNANEGQEGLRYLVIIPQIPSSFPKGGL